MLFAIIGARRKEALLISVGNILFKENNLVSLPHKTFQSE